MRVVLKHGRTKEGTTKHGLTKHGKDKTRNVQITDHIKTRSYKNMERLNHGMTVTRSREIIVRNQNILQKII